MSENFENKLGKVFDSEIRSHVRETKEWIKDDEEAIREATEDLKFHIEWLKLQESSLEQDKIFKEDGDFDPKSVDDSIEYTLKRIEEVSKEIENMKQNIAEFTLNKAEHQAYIDEWNEAEKEWVGLCMKIDPNRNN